MLEIPSLLQQINKTKNLKNINFYDKINFILEYNFSVKFQKILDKNGKIIKYEVLLDGENIEKFVNELRNENKSLDLFEFVLKKSFSKIKGNKNINISVNAFPDDIASKTFIEKLEKYLEEYDIQAENLTIEILETKLNENLEKNFLKNLKKLKKKGVKLAIDDFGCKYSNKERLKKLKEYISILKIDGEYLKKIIDNLGEHKDFFSELDKENIQIIFEHVDNNMFKKLKETFGNIDFLIQGNSFGEKESNF